MKPSAFLIAGGGYRKLRSFKMAQAIYDLTVEFVNRFIERGSRTKDQMVQAARSGAQNIAEGSQASTTSKETEIKLTNVAKASLEELLLDYEDYLRQHKLNLWGKDNSRTVRLRGYLKTDEFVANPTALVDKMNAEEYCNLCILLINQTTYLLRRLIERQQVDFLKHGGIREQMTKARINYRKDPTG